MHSPNAVLRRGIESQTEQKRNPKSQENQVLAPLSGKIHYSIPPAYVRLAAQSGYFTDD